uniref:Protein kinase domain-containing protein n=1 Tax=Salix viminalis TaxID=40686 RepID=A0A6N2LA82_SALVM
MAFHNFLPGLLITLLATLLAIVFSSDTTQFTKYVPFTCSDSEVIRICNASLYIQLRRVTERQLASIYGVSPSRIISISSASRQDYLVTVPCSCKNINGNVGYFYDAIHNLRFLMGKLGGLKMKHALHDTLSDISSRLSSTAGGIQSMNINLIKNPSSINVDRVLFVPMGTFESEKPVIFSLEESEEATKSFAKTKKIGEGGYGCVYHGFLRGQEVAVKKMRSNKSHEFFAELKVYKKFEDQDPETALADVIDKNLRNSYPMEDAYKDTLVDEENEKSVNGKVD